MLCQLLTWPIDVNGIVTYFGVLICGTDSSMDLHLLRFVFRVSSSFQGDIPLQLHIIYTYFRN